MCFQVAEMASWLLSLLSTEVDTSLTCLQHPGVVDAHIRHGSRESSSAQEETAWTFAVVSAEPKTVGTLVHSRGCFALLLRLIQRPPEEVRLQAAWALANLSLQPKATAHLLSLCAVSHLVGTLRTAQSEALIHQAMRCLGTLLTDAQARAQLLEMCGEAGDASWALAFFARHASSPAEALQETALRALVHSLAQPFSLSHTFLELPGAEGIERLCGLLTDQESLSDRRAGIVCSAVLQLALATTSRDASTARDEATFPTPLTQCIEPVLSMAANDELTPGARVHAVAAIRQLACCNAGDADHTLAEHIVLQGALPILESLANSREAEHAGLRAGCAAAMEVLTRCLTPSSRRTYATWSRAHAWRPEDGSSVPRRIRRCSPLGVDALRVELPRNMPQSLEDRSKPELRCMVQTMSELATN